MKEDPQIPKGMVIPKDFLKQLWEGKNKIWPTCLECGTELGNKFKAWGSLSGL